MNYLKSVKATFVNWFNENQRLGFIILGAIGLPLCLFFGLGVLTLIVLLLTMLGLSTESAIIVIVLMITGAIGGLLAYNWLGDND
jgi:hypothetical protein